MKNVLLPLNLQSAHLLRREFHERHESRSVTNRCFSLKTGAQNFLLFIMTKMSVFLTSNTVKENDFENQLQKWVKEVYLWFNPLEID